MRFIFLLFIFSTAKAQNVQINGIGSTVTINAPGQPGITINYDSGIRDIILISGQSNAGGFHNLVTDNSVLVPFGFTGLKTSIFVMQDNETFLNQNIPNPAGSLNPLNGIENWSAEQHTVQNLPRPSHGPRRLCWIDTYAAASHPDA